MSTRKVIALGALIVVVAFSALLVVVPAHARASSSPPAAALSGAAPQTGDTNVFESAAPYLLSLVVGSGGLFMFVDRRGKKALELASTAAESADAIKEHLEIEHDHRKELETQLKEARNELHEALMINDEQRQKIDQLETRVKDLEQQLTVSRAKIEGYEDVLLHTDPISTSDAQ